MDMRNREKLFPLVPPTLEVCAVYVSLTIYLTLTHTKN